MSENIDYNYLSKLNAQQREAVEYLSGPSLVIAGAGSGKTRVLTYKIIHLLRLGYEPYRIMALTFTNKAAREMKSRIEQTVGEKAASKLMMGTFHSIFLRILRVNAEKVGYRNGFTIYDTTDSKNLLKMILKEMGIDDKDYKISTLLNSISNAKNALILPQDYLSNNELMSLDRKSKRPLTGVIYEAYFNRCRIANAMDFDDILLYMSLLLRNNPDIRRHYQELYRYILVDEYQDTNKVQFDILKMLAGDECNLTLVGDDAQSIFSFRGAQLKNILNIEEKFPGLKTFKLEQNYRSTQNIIEAAGSLIEKNSFQIPKNLFSENKVGDKIEIVSAYSDLEEAFLVANLINQKKLTLHDSYDEYAVLYRTNSQSRTLEESLRKRAIPYRLYGSVSFYQRKEVKDAVAYFRLAVNPDDDESLRRIINFPARGIGETTMKKLIKAASDEGKSIWSVIRQDDLKTIGLNSGTIKKISAFRELIEEFINDNNAGSNAYELGQLIFNRTGLLALYAYENTPESISRHENLTEIMSGLKNFVEDQIETGEGKSDMQTFLSNVMLATDQDQKEDDTQPKVTLMTIHSAKGLEYKHVYIVGVEEDLLPAALSQTSLLDVEEERRLLYVAITRAKETCTLTYAGSRFRNGQNILTSPSRFLQDINPKFLDHKKSSNIGKSEYSVNPGENYKRFQSLERVEKTNPWDKYERITKRAQLSENFKSVKSLSQKKVVPQHSANEITPGDRILHAKFGEGIVKSIGNISGEPSINVEFKEMGLKRLLLKFAKFEILK